MNISDIIESYLCYGCGTCNVVCGHSAIHMEYDNIGRLLPHINKEKCVDCGLCRKYCPSIDLDDIQLPKVEDKFVGNIKNVYIGRASDEDIFRNSQSGGMVTATVKYLLESGKIDAAIMCRVDYSINYLPKAVVITSADELHDCQKSSYVPVDIVSAIKQIDCYNSVAVIGTACHIQGVKSLHNYSKKYKEKIKYTIGLICDRTLCKTVTDVLYGEYYRNEKKKIVWRDKTHKYSTARLLIQTNKKIKRLPRWQRFVLKDPFTNPRCRICFDKLNTNADVVFGDPWGMSNVDWKNGESLVLIRTDSGESIIEEIIHGKIAFLNEAPLSEVITGQQINTRRNEVASSIAYYKRKGWIIPHYCEKLNPSVEIDHLSNMMSEFVSDSLLTKEDIIKKNRLLLKSRAKENRIQKLKQLPIIILKLPYTTAIICYSILLKIKRIYENTTIRS